MEKVMIFIDGSNFYHGLENSRISTKIDFGNFAKLLCGERKLIRIYYYNVLANAEDDKERYQSQCQFFDALERTPYLMLKLGRLMRRGNTVVEKGVDILIATDMLSMAYAESYDTAILVSGDGDFAACIEEVKRIGKHVEVAYFRVGFSSHLEKTADKTILLDKGYLASCFR